MKARDKQSLGSGKLNDAGAKLSERQKIFLRMSAFDYPASQPGMLRLMSAADWRTARSLVRIGFGRIVHEPR